MVKIIDGEIVADDDPRVRSPAPVRRATSTGPGVPPGGGGGAGGGGGGPPAQAAVFDWNAPPFRVAPDTDGSGMGGMPSLVIYGARFPPQHLLMLAAAVLFFGWKGGLVAGIVWYFWASSAAGGGGAGGQQQRRTAAQEFFQSLPSMFDQAPLGRGGGAAQSSGSSAARPPGAQRPPAQADPWALRGKARKLNDA